MTITLRHAEPEDAPQVHAILISPHVAEGTMRLTYMPLATTRDRLVAQPGRYQLVALRTEEIVGFAELITHPENPRWAHYGEINLVATREDMQRQGVARALIAGVIDLADSQLGLERLELKVWSANATAQRVYEAFGFEEEGTLRRYARSATGFNDAIVMGRLRLP
ncbi:putative acetyltransferase [Aliiruegeria haliotis]|uniref:Putative acetyltransferase n=1 Tax=Aliiruegeria haliotis TaxID=1280846 RepID=A0A2T0RM66_9RHOB|nr:GNAT family N-acetyltransferase [Aliiruegeria haliotis]PRY22212.1 putative acetyltransferase [Aliiruegeria haliotis]